MGLIYRVVHDDYKPDSVRPSMLHETSAALVMHLDHPNGWWRDNAQIILILRNDVSIVPALEQIVLNNNGPFTAKPSHLARIHALWTLEGMEQLKPEILYKAFNDEHPQVRKAAVWISELLIKKDDRETIDRLAKLKNDVSPDVRIQLFLSLRSASSPQAKNLVGELIKANPDNELIQYSNQTYLEAQKMRAAELAKSRNLSPQHRKLVQDGQAIFKSLCASCHGTDGKGIKMGGGEMPAPPIAGSHRVQGDKIMNIQLLLNGLKGPVDGKTYPDIMPSMDAQSDEWIAAVLSYIRNSVEMQNKSSVVTPDEVKDVRANTPKIAGGMTIQQLEIFKLGRAESANWKKK